MAVGPDSEQPACLVRAHCDLCTLEEDCNEAARQWDLFELSDRTT